MIPTPPPLTSVCKTSPENTEKRGRAWQSRAPSDEAAQAPNKTARLYTLPEPLPEPFIDPRAGERHILTKSATKKTDTTAVGKSTGEKTNTTRYGGKAQVRSKFAHSTHLSDLIALTNKAYIPLDTEPNMNLPISTLPTDTQLPNQHPWE